MGKPVCCAHMVIFCPSVEGLQSFLNTPDKRSSGANCTDRSGTVQYAVERSLDADCEIDAPGKLEWQLVRHRM